VAFEDARQVQPRYPEPRARRFSWSANPVDVYEGSTTVPIRATLSRDAATGERPLRMRVLFQACTETRCDPPESMTLEVPFRIGPRG
jgi:Thiol:disulfide interchange protein DsbD, N-terminal